MDSKNVRLLYLFNFFSDFRFYYPIAIIYFTKISGSYSLGMSVFAVARLSAAIFEVPTGILSDMVGRKKTIILGAIASLLSVLCYALGLSYWFLILGALFEGLAISLFSGNNDALLYDTLAEKKSLDKYHTLLGKTSSMFQLALGLSALLGGVISQFSLSLALWLSVISQFLCLLIVLFLSEPKRGSQQNTNIYSHLKLSLIEFRTNKKLRLVSLSSIIGFGIGEASWNFRSAFIALYWPLWALGIAQTLSNIGATLSFFFSGRLINKFSELKLLVAGSIYSRITDLFGLIFPSVLSPALMSTSSLFFGVTTIAEKNLLQKEFTDQQRATMGSLNALGGNLFFAFYAVALGIIADHFGVINALITSNICLFLVIWIYRKVYLHK